MCMYQKWAIRTFWSLQDIVYMYKYMTKLSRLYMPIVKVTCLHRSGGGSDAVIVENSCKWFSDTFDVR